VNIRDVPNLVWVKIIKLSVCNVVCVTSYHELMLGISHVRLLKRCASITLKFLFAISSLYFFACRYFNVSIWVLLLAFVSSHINP
jgi:hypothetical protein